MNELTLAIKAHDIERVRRQLTQAVDINAGDSQGVTPLMVAAKHGQTAISWLLLESGAKLDAQCSFGYTALMFAVHDGHEETVKMLLERGADPNVRANDNGLVSGGSIGDDTPLYLAVTCNYPAIAQLLIDYGAEADFVDNDGLHTSISINHPLT